MLVAAGVAAAATIAIDQTTKAIVRGTMAPGEIHRADQGGQFSIGHVKNHGAAYGSFDGIGAAIPAVVTGALGAGLLFANRRSTHPLLAGIGAGMAIGGGIGNVIDRAHQDYVTDFIHTTDAFGYYNVADVGITGGIGLAGAAWIFGR
jgi:signal peptidase II